MAYDLGVDLGTTFSAVAVASDATAQILSLGYRDAIVPSVVLVRPDGVVLVGEAAERRALTEGENLAREFKRRIGDPAPYLLAGRPYSAESLSAKLLRALVNQVTERQGGPPDRICLTHPANWSAYRKELLAEVARLADVGYVSFLTEPEAAAIAYASETRVAPGSTIAVYDLGGGTFDAAVLRKTTCGFDLLGAPEGVERLGGIDFDAAVWAFVNRAVDGALSGLDHHDPMTVAAASRLRAECVAAKEILSVDTVADIPVIVPGVHTMVRITRAEFEAMVTPALQESVDALGRTLRSAGIEAESLDAVLLVGGSSRIPLVAQLVAADLGVPVALDAHPKHAVALGAARHALFRDSPLPVEPGPAAAPAAPASDGGISSTQHPPLTPLQDAPEPAIGNDEDEPLPQTIEDPAPSGSREPGPTQLGDHGLRLVLIWLAVVAVLAVIALFAAYGAGR